MDKVLPPLLVFVLLTIVFSAGSFFKYMGNFLSTAQTWGLYVFGYGLLGMVGAGLLLFALSRIDDSEEDGFGILALRWCISLVDFGKKFVIVGVIFLAPILCLRLIFDV